MLCTGEGLRLFQGTIAVTSVALLFACGVGGGSDSLGAITVAPTKGPGDTDAIFPLAMGDTWNYRITETEDLNGFSQTKTYVDVFRVIGTRQLSGTTVSVIRDDNDDGTQTTLDRYFEKIRGGVNNWGTSDPSNSLSSTLRPYAELFFPVVPGSDFDRFRNVQVELKQDLDRDGALDRVTLDSSVSVVSLEDVQVTAGSFPGTRRVEEDEAAIIRLSRDGTELPISSSVTIWYAPSVGQVKETVVTTASGPGGVLVVSAEADLLGFDVGGVKKGIQPELSIGTPGLVQPCEPAVGYDGKRYLVAFMATKGRRAKLFGSFLTEDGTQSPVFTIADESMQLCQVGTRPIIAYDGTNYLVVYGRSDRIYGIRISPDGTILDPDGGFQISNTVFPAQDFAPAIAFDGTNYFVVWHRRERSLVQEGLAIIGAFVTPHGVAGSEFTIASRPDSGRQYPAVSFDGSNYLVAWADQRNTRSGYAHVYAGRVTPQGLVLEPDGVPVATTASYKFSIRSVFDGANHRVSWWDQVRSRFEARKFLSKRVAPSGKLIDGPTTSEGLAVVTRNVAREAEILVGGTDDLVIWTVASEQGANSVVNTGVNSLVVWGHTQKLYGAFVYH